MHENEDYSLGAVRPRWRRAGRLDVHLSSVSEVAEMHPSEKGIKEGRQRCLFSAGPALPP